MSNSAPICPPELTKERVAELRKKYRSEALINYFKRVRTSFPPISMITGTRPSELLPQSWGKA
jgi:hypothetical protein